MEQRRLFLALILSTVILLGWSYFFQPSTPQQNLNTSQPPSGETSQTPSQKSENAVRTDAVPSSPNAEIRVSEDKVPSRTLIVTTPLYEVEIDSRGAVVKSWVIKQNKDTGRPLYSI